MMTCGEFVKIFSKTFQENFDQKVMKMLLKYCTCEIIDFKFLYKFIRKKL